MELPPPPKQQVAPLPTPIQEIIESEPAPLEATLPDVQTRPSTLEVSSQSIEPQPSMSVQVEPLSSEAFPSSMQVEEFEFDMDDKTEERAADIR